MNDGGSEVPTIPRREPTALATVPATNANAEFTSLLMQAATDPSFDAEKMRAMFDMKRQWDADEAKRAYVQAMIACQAEMPKVERNKFNKQTQSWYADITSIHDAMKPVYQRHGFSVVHSQGESHLPNHYRWIAHVSHSGGHTEMHHLDLPSDDEGIKGGKCKTAVQGAASSGTYAQRYLECRIFNVTIPWLDQDGNAPPSPPITEAQAVQVQEWIDATNTNPKRFLEWASDAAKMEITRVGELPANLHAQVKEFFRRKGAFQ